MAKVIAPPMEMMSHLSTSNQTFNIISRFSERSMQFSNCRDHAPSTNEVINLKDNNIVVFYRASQDFFRH